MRKILLSACLWLLAACAQTSGRHDYEWAPGHTYAKGAQPQPVETTVVVALSSAVTVDSPAWDSYKAAAAGALTSTETFGALPPGGSAVSIVEYSKRPYRKRQPVLQPERAAFGWW